jgi:hypothetical protein
VEQVLHASTHVSQASMQLSIFEFSILVEYLYLFRNTVACSSVSLLLDYLK